MPGKSLDKSRDSHPAQAGVLLAFLATLALELARHQHAAHPLFGWLATLGTLALVAAAGWWIQRQADLTWARLSSAVLLAVLAAAPLVAELLVRRILGNGESPEIVQIVALRNVMLVLAAAPVWPGAERLASVLSMFVALAALAFTFHWPGYVVLLAYGIVGIWWLMGTHWESMADRFPAQSRRSVPLGIGLGSTTAVLTIVGLAVLSLGGASTTVALGGWFWGSGGTGESDSFAARGVGDGDQLVAAKDQAASFGAIESELFLDSEMPSLYDMFNDMYGEPLQQQKTERAIGLAGPPESPQEQQTATSRLAGREFSTVRRQSSQRPTRLPDRDSGALFFAAGRVPLHLRLETYDHFDGRIWSHRAGEKETRTQSALRIDDIRSRPWLTIDRTTESPALCEPESHMLKIMRLAGNRIPTPAHAIGVHIDKVDQLDFYGWTADDVLQLPVRKQIPSLQVIHVRSRSLDVQKLPVGAAPPVERRAYMQLPTTRPSTAIANIARNWTAGVPAGYPQAAAIVSRLRSGAWQLDPAARVPVNAEDAAAHFLLDSRRGPDYLFATSAVVLLRELGYPARVATGFYVRPERYQRLARQTPVLADDVHFWAEVCLDGHTWITLEPTPGYEVLPPRRTWGETLAICVGILWNNVRTHPLFWCTAILLALAAMVFRRDLSDGACTLIWLAGQLREGRMRVLATVWLLERRATLAGLARPPHVTLGDWYLPLSRELSAESHRAVSTLLAAATRCLYAPPGYPSVELNDPVLAAACRTVATQVTSRALSRVASPRPQPTILVPHLALNRS